MIDDESLSEDPTALRRKSLTPEQRRVLGSARSFYDTSPEQSESASAPSLREPVPIGPQPPISSPPRDRQQPFKKTPIAATPSRSEPSRASRTTNALPPDRRSSRLIEVPHVLLLFVAMLLLASAFYVGKKFDYWRYLIQSRNKPELSGVGPANQFPGVSSDDLVEQALMAEQSGNWQEVADKLLAAKYKNLGHRGILLRVAKMAFEHGDVDVADKLFDRAIAFGENLDLAHYFRGLIAMKRRDYPAALRSFEAAATAEPFSSHYRFYWAEALRADHHPAQAILYYEQALRRTRSEQDQAVCGFKIRLARLEAGEANQLETEIENNRSKGDPSVDWLMTDAAFKIRQGKISETGQLISAARSASKQSLFESCVADSIFQDASSKYPELSEVCRTEGGIPSAAP